MGNVYRTRQNTEQKQCASLKSQIVTPIRNPPPVDGELDVLTVNGHLYSSYIRHKWTVITTDLELETFSIESSDRNGYPGTRFNTRYPGTC